MINKRLINTGAEAAPAAFDPLQNFETVTYTGNGGTQKITGYIRKGAAFNGSSSKITIPEISPESISMWVNLDTLDRYDALLGHSTNTANYIYWADSSESYQLRLGNLLFGSGTAKNTVGAVGSWVNVVFVDNGSGTVTCYIDGSNAGSVSGSLSSYNEIGARTASTDQYLKGKIDQVRIFNTALNSTQVAELALEEYGDAKNSVTDFFGNGTGVALYELDEDAKDTGDTYNGTPTNVDFLGMAFQPDLVWLKNRDSAIYNNLLFDSVRGADITILTDSTNAQYDGGGTGYMSSFDSNGFTLISGNLNTNNNGTDYVAWNWKAGGAAVSNTDGVTSGSVTEVTSAVSANQEAGFSICQFTTPSSGKPSWGHGLSQAPELIIVKRTDDTNPWFIYAPSILGQKELRFNTALATPYTPDFISVDSSKIDLGSSSFNIAGSAEHINYNFHSVDGYQKVGSYPGNGGSSVNSITTGFQPRFLMIKRTDASGYNWVIYDSIRDTANPRNIYLNPNTTDAESGPDTSVSVNFVSDGFEIPTTSSWAGINASGATIIYLAIA